jgi:GH43 family beta-xylosidase
MEGADPAVVRHEDDYLWTFAHGNRAIALHCGPWLHAPGPGRIVWTAPDSGPCSQEFWAPELHHVGGRWHIYFAASDGDNSTHRAYVLVGQPDDPFGPYELAGPLYTGDDPGLQADNRWAIDFTVHEHENRLYGFWSGWEDEQDVQYLYAAPMADPTSVSGPRVRLARNDTYVWERVEPGGRGLNEAPQIVLHDGRLHVLFSASASWLPSYCIGHLELRGTDPLDPSHWYKHPQPVLAPDEQVCGIGHGCVVPAPDGSQNWLVHHAKVDSEPGWRRAVHIQPFSWHRHRPVIGAPRPRVPLPRGSTPPVERSERTVSLDVLPADLHYLGHHQLLECTQAGLVLGNVPEAPANLFRCGEKALLRDPAPGDLDLVVEFTTAADQRDVGVLFRCSDPTLGYDAQYAYFAGVIPEDGRLLIGRTDSSTWRELASTHLEPAADGHYRLEVSAVADRLRVRVGDVTVEAFDDVYTSGMVGLRVVDAQATFHLLEYRPAQSD